MTKWLMHAVEQFTDMHTWCAFQAFLQQLKGKLRQLLKSLWQEIFSLHPGTRFMLVFIKYSQEIRRVFKVFQSENT